MQIGVVGIFLTTLCVATPIAHAALSVTTSPVFSLDFSDATKVSGSTWTDQVAAKSASAVGTTFSNESGGIQTFTASTSYLDFSATTAGTPTNPASDISGEVWVKFNTFNVNWNIFMTRWFSDLAGAQSDASDFHFAVYSATGAANTQRLNLYTTGKADLNGATTIVTGKWYHFVFTVDNTSATKKITLYVNGVEDATFTSVSSLRTSKPNSKLIIGDSRANTGLNGQMARARLYNKALTAAEVVSNFNADRSSLGYGSTVTLSASNSTYRLPTTLTAATSGAGKVAFFASGKVISGCQRKSAVTSATCSWKPNRHGPVELSALFTPTDIYIAPSSGSKKVLIAPRTTPR
jgi:hypothetical protein